MSTQSDAVPLLGEGGGEVERRRRLGDAALLVGERDDLGLSFHCGLRCSIGRKPAVRWVFACGAVRFLHASAAFAAWELRSGHGHARRQAQARAGAPAQGRACAGQRAREPAARQARVHLRSAPAASARRRPRRRSRSGSRRAARRSLSSRSTPRTARLGARAAGAVGRADTRIEPSLLAEHGVACSGELWAMMLDSKGTFDEIVTRLAPNEREREELLANRSTVSSPPRSPARRSSARWRSSSSSTASATSTCRARHAAVAQRARLPRGADAPARLSRRTRDGDLPLAGAGSRRARARPLDGPRLRDLRARHRRRAC